MNKIEFDVLKSYAITKKSLTQRELSLLLNCSLGKINKVVKQCRENGWINDDGLTENGIKELVPYKVRNAIIMAAGMSSRFAPLSYENPKGLLKVKGEVLIERQIRQLQEKGIFDITLVIGYMKEKFFYLEDKFGVKLVINEDYYRYNNTSTLICVKDRVSNTYICSSDNYFTENVFETYVYRAYYSAVYSKGYTDEYCMKCDSQGKITQVTVGGKDAWYMIGHAYFSEDFSRTFFLILEKEYSNLKTKTQLWEDLYIRYIRELNMYIKRYSVDIIKEFDSLDELRDFDDHYIENTDSEIFTNICKTLNCEGRDIEKIEPIKSGLTNTSFSFQCKGEKYVYRHPGVGTEEYINRKSEAYAMRVAKEMGLDDTFIYMSEIKGWKLSKYIDNAKELDYHNAQQVSMALQVMSTLHNKKIKSEYNFDIWGKTLLLMDKIKIYRTDLQQDFYELYKQVKDVKDHVDKDKVEKRLCHCDCYSPNFLIDEYDKIYLIDWEYAGNDDPGCDLGTFICCSDYSYDEAVKVIEEYLERTSTPQLLNHYIGYVSIASFYWYVWAIYQECRGKTVGEYLYLWYKMAHFYSKKTIDLYN